MYVCDVIDLAFSRELLICLIFIGGVADCPIYDKLLGESYQISDLSEGLASYPSPLRRGRRKGLVHTPIFIGIYPDSLTLHQ
jgi:hypothetical protein